MITELRIENFKSWRDTGTMRFAGITGFFGTNSSGKSSILQFLLMLKQTVESPDRKQVLDLGGSTRSYVDLGTIKDIAHNHALPSEIKFSIAWNFSQPLRINIPMEKEAKEERRRLTTTNQLSLKSVIRLTTDNAISDNFSYNFYPVYQASIGLKRKSARNSSRKEYQITIEGFDNLDFSKFFGKKDGKIPLESLMPVKFYDSSEPLFFSIALANPALRFAQLWQTTYYLGPLREPPNRTYIVGGGEPDYIGRRGEVAVGALIAAQRRGKYIERDEGQEKQTLQERVAEGLKHMGLIASFEVRPIARGQQIYQVYVKESVDSAEVTLPDVGFGISQVLPVLTLLYYVPEGSTVILEQPELHLHPSAQSVLADVLIDAMKTRKIQIILESHSEHLVHRLQRRIAEIKSPYHIDRDQVALYFSERKGSESCLNPLDVDEYGNITNWPKDFFGDQMGDIFAQTEAEMERKMAQEQTSTE